MISFIPSKKFHDVLNQGRVDVETWCKQCGPKKEAKWAEWAGGELEKMMKNREYSIKLLRSSNTSLRLAAISLVAQYWPANEKFAADTLRLAFEDTEPAVRGAALMALWQTKQYILDSTNFLSKLFRELFPMQSHNSAEVLQWFAQKSAQGEKMWEEAWQKGAGSHASQMAKSRQLTELYLCHPKPEIRCAAIMALKHHWKPDDNFPKVCEALVLHDSSISVRGLALASLSSCYAHSDNTRVGSFVARLVCDESELNEIRNTAYKGLLMIRGMPYERLIEAGANNFRFPEDVDWAFVKSFLESSGDFKGGH